MDPDLRWRRGQGWMRMWGRHLVKEQKIHPVEEPGSIHPLDESLCERIISLGFSLFICKGGGVEL